MLLFFICVNNSLPKGQIGCFEFVSDGTWCRPPSETNLTRNGAGLMTFGKPIATSVGRIYNCRTALVGRNDNCGNQVR